MHFEYNMQYHQNLLVEPDSDESNISHTHWITFVFLKSGLLNHVLSLSIHIDRNLNVTMHHTNS